MYVLLKVLGDQDNLQVHKWDKKSPIQTNMLIATSGKCRTSILKNRQECWCECHRCTHFPIHSISEFLTHKVKQGTVYTVGSLNVNDKKGRPHDDPQPSRDVVTVPQAIALGTPQQEFKRRRLIPRSESMVLKTFSSYDLYS